MGISYQEVGTKGLLKKLTLPLSLSLCRVDSTPWG